MVQDRSVTNHGLFFFTMARVYAKKGDAENCAVYLRKSLDEGYKDLVKAKTDPAFKTVIDDPGVQAVLARITPPDPKTAMLLNLAHSVRENTFLFARRHEVGRRCARIHNPHATLLSRVRQSG